MRYNQTVQMICNLAKNKGVISRRFFLEGLKVLLNSKKKMGFYEFRSVGNVIELFGLKQSLELLYKL